MPKIKAWHYWVGAGLVFTVAVAIDKGFVASLCVVGAWLLISAIAKQDCFGK